MAEKIVVAMSGGVDSSVAAALLRDQGYDVVGVTLKTRDWNDENGRKFGGCCGSSDFYDARAVAQTLGIPHYSFDYVDEFKISVIGYFKDSYVAGETPNPCIACNQFVKFDRLLAHAQALGADYLATGHYARIQHAADGHVLRKAVDARKDQSYVLYHLGQSQLAKLKFPVGEYAKPDIRGMARRYGLRTAEKPDSQEICFVPNNDYRGFIAEQVPAEARRPGPIRDSQGKLLGQHEGLPYYTVGQRSGLGLAVGHPLYVVALDTESNTLVVGGKDDVLGRQMRVRQVSWVAGVSPELPLRASVKIRYKHAEAAAVLTVEGETGRQGDWETASGKITPSPRQPVAPSLMVTFDEPQSALTPGQAAVFYDGDRVLGGGAIDHVNG